MSSPLEVSYRTDAVKVIRRHREWFDRAGKRRCLVTIIPKPFNIPEWDLSINIKTKRPLNEYDFSKEDDIREAVDYRLAQLMEHWERKSAWELDDDMLPVFEPRLGWAEGAAACMDTRIMYYSQTSNVQPVIETYAGFDFKSIRFNPDSQAAKILKTVNEYAARRAKGRFFIQPRGEMLNPSDLAKACRGDALLTDFFDNPEDVRRLLDVCLAAVIALIDWARKVTNPVANSLFCAWLGGYWTPERVLGHVGDNLADLISAPMYKEFILPVTSRFAAHFGGMIFGRDITSKHLWSILPKMSQILAFQPRQMGATDVTTADIREIAEQTGDIPLFLVARDATVFKEYARVVKDRGLKVFFVVHCAGRDQAARVLEEARSMG